ncbi:MAG: chorismate synthase, partial [Firmicutes bacterium]|nr:chorismate synthase [Bacillota bacterium]
MSSVFGENIKFSVFGQSHSEGIGVVIDGLPAGESIDMQRVADFMARRAPGRNPGDTPRREA